MNFKNISLFLFLIVGLLSCIIQNPTPDECIIKTEHIFEIDPSTSYDIVFNNSTSQYYINRGTQRGLKISELKEKVLNKTVTLHLAPIRFGVSRHIVQIEVDKEIIFTEFK